jgi:membrane-bound ClpP family serine protease
MNAQGRFAGRVIWEIFLIVAGWGLVIASIVNFIAGNIGLGVVMVVGAGIAFALHASSLRRKPSSAYIEQHRRETDRT